MMVPILAVKDYFIKNGVAWADNWLIMMGLALLIAVIIHTALLMFGRSLKIPELERYAQSEMLQAAATAVMAGSLVAMVGAAAQFSTGLVSGEVLCGGEARNIVDDKQTFNNALDVVRCRIQEKASAIAEIQDRLTTSAFTWLKFFTQTLSMAALGVTFFKGDWIPDLYEETETIRITNNLATVLLIGLNAISFLVLYVKNTMLSFFIPLGIVLRAFHFTRGAGALFIALGIGLYFIFPVIFVMLDPGFTKIDIPEEIGGTIETDTLCYTSMSAATTIVQTNTQKSSGSTIAAGQLRDQLAQAYVGLILHPLVSLFLTLAFVRYMMVVLGGDSYALMRMVSKVI
jgi:hypothetical protein